MGEGGCCCPRVGPQPQNILRPSEVRSGHGLLSRWALGTMRTQLALGAGHATEHLRVS